MKIGIIGTGRVSAALKAGWMRVGHEVRAGSRSTRHSPAQIARWADVLVLAVPYSALENVVAGIGPATDQIIIDCTNPIAMGPDGMELAIGHTNSGAEQLQALLPEAKIVKTLNQVGVEVMADTHGFAHKPVQILAGNDGDAKQTVTKLLKDLGFEPLDAGGLSKARLLEPFAMVWINQAIARNKGRDWTFSAIARRAGS